MHKTKIYIISTKYETEQRSATLLITLFLGIGTGLMMFLSFLVVQYYFDERRSMATGIVAIGSSVGLFVFPFLTRTLISKYGWRWTFRIEALICLIGGCCGFLFRSLEDKDTDDVENKNNNEEKKIILDKSEEKKNQELYKDPMLYVLCFSNFTYSIGLYIPFNFTPERAHSLGISLDQSALIVCLFGITIFIERVFFGWIGKCIIITYSKCMITA